MFIDIFQIQQNITIFLIYKIIKFFSFNKVLKSYLKNIEKYIDRDT